MDNDMMGERVNSQTEVNKEYVVAVAVVMGGDQVEH